MPRHALFAVLVVCLLGSTLPAQQPTDDGLASIAPLINNETCLVVRINLRRLDLSAVKKQFIDPALHTDADRTDAAASFEKLQRLVQNIAGTGNGLVFVVLTLPQTDGGIVLDLPNLARSTFVVLPTGLAANVKQDLEAALRFPVLIPSPFPFIAQAGPKLTEIRGLTVLAVPELNQYLANLRPAARPEFAKALAVGRTYPINAAVAPPPNFARVAEQIFLEQAPGTNKSWGRLVGQGLQWMGVGVETNLDKFGAEITVQSADAAAASALSDALKNFLMSDLTTRPPSSNGAINALVSAQILSLLPMPREDQLILNLTGERALTLGALAKQLYVEGMKNSWQKENMNHLKQFGLALLNYDDKYRQLPDRAIRDKEGKPLLSWRVAILPEIDCDKLYKQFHLDEPWDSEHNRKLIEKMPDIFRCAGDAETKPGYTRYLAAVGENCAFPPDRGAKLNEFTDGTSGTILVVEAAPQNAVLWTKPDDLNVDLENPRRGLVAKDQDFNAVRADGSVLRYSTKMSEKSLRAYFTRNGGEKIER